MTERVVLVTGANKGIGFEVASALGAAGCRVILGARDAARGEAVAAALAASGVAAWAIHLDLLDPVSIVAATAEIEAREGRLDVLVNNAGIAVAGDGPPTTAAIDAVRRVFDTNFFGTLAVTQAMVPLLRRGNSARIVTVSSGLGSLALSGDPTWEFASVERIGYAASKAALNMLTVQLAAELGATITVHSVDPGFTATDLNGRRGRQTVAEGAEAVIAAALGVGDRQTGDFRDRHGRVPW